MKIYIETLKTLQKDFLLHIFPDKKNSGTSSLPYFSNHQKKNITIYQNSFQSQFKKILTHYYPASFKLMGATRFQYFMNEYLSCQKPNHFVISQMADGFFRFMKKMRYHHQFPLWVDLILFEKLMAQSHVSENSKIGDLQKIKKLDDASWFALRPTLNPAIKILLTHYSIGELWQTLMKAMPIPNVTYDKKFFKYIFYHQSATVFFIALNDDDWRLIHMLRLNQSIDDCVAKISWRSIEKINEWLFKGILTI